MKDGRGKRESLLSLYGVLFISLGIVYSIPIVVSMFYSNEIMYTKYFSYPATILIVIGIILRNVYREPKYIQTKTAMFFSTTAWIIASAVTIVPLVVVSHMSIINAFFETVSAWTGTGLTLMTGIDESPKIIIFWRSLMQWLGGLGIIVFAMIILKYPTIAKKLYKAEARDELIIPNAVETGKRLFLVYLSLTIMFIILLYFGGMSLFDSINYAMTAVGTGGMAPHDDSVAYYASPIVHVIVILAMIAGATSFSTIYFTVKRKSIRILFSDKQFIILILLPVILAIFYYVPVYGSSLNLIGVKDTLFQEYSAMTCTGFNTVNISRLPDISKAVLVILMVIGGSTMSTAGAIKIIRFLFLLEAIRWIIKKNLYPDSAVVVPKFFGVAISIDEFIQPLAYSLLYIVSLIVATFITSFVYPTSFIDALFENASALGNVGLSTGITSPGMPNILKGLFIIEMILGRLEFFAVIVSLIVIVKSLKRL